MTAKSIYLMRHGEVEGAGRALYGRTDVPLSELGWDNLRRQCNHLPNLDVVVTSPLQRCAGFAQEIAQARDISLHQDLRLVECDFGDFDGVPFDQLQSQWSKLEQFWRAPDEGTLPGAEPLGAMYHRVSEGWNSLLALDASRILVVTHGGVIRLLLAHILAWDWRNGALYSQLSIANGSVSKVTLGEHVSSVPVVKYIGWLDRSEDGL